MNEFEAAKPLKVWCVLDRKPGHRNLARGMVAALGAVRPVQVIEITVQPWIVPVGKILQFAWPFGAGLARRAGVTSVRESGRSPDLVVGSGGNVLWFTSALARTVGATAVFVGSRRHLPADAVGAFVHYDPTLEAEGTLCLPVLPGPFGPKEQKHAWANFAAERGWSVAQRHLVALIGGDGSGYCWRAGDGAQLARLFRALHESTGQTWLVTTSRRTPPEVEAAIRAALPTAAIADASWFHAGDQRRVVSAYLGGAAAVFVSEDSMSMIHEAITSGQRVVTLRPAQARPPLAHRNYIDHAAAQGWIKPHALDERTVTEAANVLDAVSGYPGDALVDAGRALLAHLARRRSV